MLAGLLLTVVLIATVSFIIYVAYIQHATRPKQAPAPPVQPTADADDVDKSRNSCNFNPASPLSEITQPVEMTHSQSEAVESLDQLAATEAAIQDVEDAGRTSDVALTQLLIKAAEPQALLSPSFTSISVGTPENEHTTTEDDTNNGQHRTDSSDSESLEKTNQASNPSSKVRRVVEPSKRGGRTREKKKTKAHRPVQELKSRNHTPERNRAQEIVCQIKGRRWQIEFENFDGTREEYKHNSTAGAYLLFKLNSSMERGRQVQRVGKGAYLCVVPVEWKLVTGCEQHEHESVNIAGYGAYCFDADGEDAAIQFETPQGSRTIGAMRIRFRLVGNEVADSSKKGPLFGGAPPRIQIEGAKWSAVSSIILGEEGSGKGRWRTELTPSQEEQQTLPDELAQRMAGWYFLRFYDHDSKLIDSIDFRFAAGLDRIEPFNQTLLPTDNGYTSFDIEIYHNRSWTLTQQNPGPRVEVNRSEYGTQLCIKPDPKLDSTIWRIHDEHDHAAILEILVERIWWGLGTDTDQQVEWGDKSLQLQPEDFRATSHTAIWLKLPKKRWVESLLVGFRDYMQRLPIRVTDNTCMIPLRNLSIPELTTSHAQQQIILNIEVAQSHECVIAVVPARPAPQPLDITPLQAPTMAGILTSLRKCVRGPQRIFLKETRRRYRRTASRQEDDDFIRFGLCAIAVLLRTSDSNRAALQIPKRLLKRVEQAINGGAPTEAASAWRLYEKIVRRSNKNT
jgi:hypothetical protein